MRTYATRNGLEVMSKQLSRELGESVFRLVLDPFRAPIRHEEVRIEIYEKLHQSHLHGAACYVPVQRKF